MARKTMVLAAVLAAIVATVQWRAAAEESAKSQRVFELRVYYAHPGKMSALHARFRNHTCALFKKHGMDLIGFWSPTDSKEAEEKLIYVLGYPNREAAKKSWEGFSADPDWQRARAESEKDGPLVAKVESTYMNPTDYSEIK